MSDSESELNQQENFKKAIEEPELKPHLRSSGEDFYAKHLQQSEEVEQQPPLLVVVQGPKKCGKTTLIRSLIKHYTNQKVKDPIGPITIRANRHQRITFLECPNDLHAMMDLAKVADLALIMIDASIGFEMETFEFISLLNNHGFPNVMGVLTHIDFFKDGKQFRKSRKKYKKRFEHEVGSGYKLFYISNIKNELYLKQDVHNLARFISIIKFTPVRWKSEHSFILADRFEREEGEEDNQDTVQFWGYIRGCTYRINDRIHLVGLGDCYLQSMQEMNDPCEVVVDSEKKLRTLKKKERVIYAPMTNLGFLNFEEGGGFINIPDKSVVFTDVKRLMELGQVQRGKQNESNDEEEEEDEEDDQPLQDGVKMVRDLQNLEIGLDERLALQEDVELLGGLVLKDENLPILEDNKDEGIKKSRELQRLNQRVNQAFKNLSLGVSALEVDEQIIATDLHELIYGSKQSVNNFDGSRYATNTFLPRNEYATLLRHFFVTGQEGLEEEPIENEEEKQNDVPQEKTEEDDRKIKEENVKRQKLVDLVVTTNLGLYKRGSYVKIVVKGISKEQMKQIRPNYPIVLGRVDIGEDNLGYVKVRIKRHRWYSNILKSNDPVVFSVGWRRFQTIPLYCVQDQNDRLRFIKYTPQYDYCYAVFYGTFAPQNTGLVCTQTMSGIMSKFRIAATGVIMELNHTFDVVKKLKLVGEPFKVYKNTAFIRGMFNSSLEVSKFTGGMIKTVSGLRGQIKKISKVGPEGSFRATFEDKILMSDIVFCRTWVRVEIENFCRLVGNHGDSQRLLKTIWELRRDKKIMANQNPDSMYQDIERHHRKFTPLMIPRRLEENLPFASREKVRSLSRREQIKKKESTLPVKAMLTDKEKQVYSLIQRLNTLKNEKERKRTVKVTQNRKVSEARERGQKRHLEVTKKKFKQEKTKEKFRKKNKSFGAQEN